MELHTHLQKARAAKQKHCQQRRASQIFEFNWRSTGSEFVTGWKTAAALLHMKESSLAVRLSSSKNNFQVTRVNPQHGEPDILTVSRVAPVKAKKPRGRPPKQQDWERLGSEAPGYKD